MDKLKHTQSTDDNIDELTHDDMDMLQQVLRSVQGSSPDSTFRQGEFSQEIDAEA